MATVSGCLSAIKILFTINAGKPEWDEDTGRHETNWKYCDSTRNAVDALSMFNSARDYAVCEFHIETEWDNGACTRVTVLEVTKPEVLIDGHWEQADTLTQALRLYDEWKKRPDGLMI